MLVLGAWADKPGWSAKMPKAIINRTTRWQIVTRIGPFEYLIYVNERLNVLSKEVGRFLGRG
jgi:hypothetical protein